MRRPTSMFLRQSSLPLASSPSHPVLTNCTFVLQYCLTKIAKYSAQPLRQHRPGLLGCYTSIRKRRRCCLRWCCCVYHRRPRKCSNDSLVVVYSDYVKAYLTAAGGILATEARHAAWIGATVFGQNPWNSAFEVCLRTTFISYHSP
jgi:hypothetical protein